jgi:hypothetical protein
MPSDRRDAQPGDGDRVRDQVEQQLADCLIDEMGEQSFPASDPPAWGAVFSRLEQTRRDAAPVPPA